MGKCYTILSAYTKYWHLGQYCTHPTISSQTYLKRFDGVAVKSFPPSGDQERRETPPPPNLRIGVQVSVATSQTNIAVSIGEADASKRPSGLQVTEVTGQ